MKTFVQPGFQFAGIIIQPLRTRNTAVVKPKLSTDFFYKSGIVLLIFDVEFLIFDEMEGWKNGIFVGFALIFVNLCVTLVELCGTTHYITKFH